MNHARVKAVTALAIAAIFISIVPVCLAQDAKLSYQLLNKPGGDITYQLEVVIPQQLNDYYASESHRLSSVEDFEKYITPYTLKPIADRLWQIYDNDEDFVNGVLMLVHQITYEETTPAYYPTETMVAGKGDCDLFSYIAASIMKAGGLNVVLFYYEDQEHMNIGVQLDNPPTDNRGKDYYVEYANATYYIAECTGGNWKQGWRVGECPDDYKGISTQVVPLDNAVRVDPGQVSASFSIMQSSTLSLEVSPVFMTENSDLTIKGQISPQLKDQNVTIYAKINFGSWEVIGSTLTKADGSYEFNWQSQTGGVYSIQASWSGTDNYTGALSYTKSTLMLPTYLIMLLVTSAFAACLGGFAAAKRSRSRKVSKVIPTEPQAGSSEGQQDFQI
ncbi:MAG: Ig-like domain-containing protein [Candidatus Bathyarchaeia archaeon]|jgi:hypothetical protein